MKPTVNDMAKIADTVTRTAELLAETGTVAYERVESWQTGLRSPNLDPVRAARYEDGELVPNDPTGEAGVHPDNLRDVHDRFRDDLAHLATYAARVTATLISAAVTAPRTDPTIGLADDGWCVSCARDHGYCEPITENAGRRIYADVCRWCGDFRRNEGQVPPLAILRERHRGTRITTRMVEQATGRRG